MNWFATGFPSMSCPVLFHPRTNYIRFYLFLAWHKCNGGAISLTRSLTQLQLLRFLFELTVRVTLFVYGSYLHQPVKVGVQIAGERFVNLYHRHKVLVGEQQFVLVVEHAG